MCKKYVEYLKQTDRGQAMLIAKDGINFFEYGGFEEILLKLSKETDPEYHVMLMDAFISTQDWKYYEKLKKISKDWPTALRSMLRHLQNKRATRTVIEIMLKENRPDDALSEIVDCGSVVLLEHFHGDLYARDPDLYYSAYKIILGKIRIESTRFVYKKFAGRLKGMKSIPGHEEDFARFIKSLRDKNGRRPALLDEIKHI